MINNQFHVGNLAQINFEVDNLQGFVLVSTSVENAESCMQDSDFELPVEKLQNHVAEVQKVDTNLTVTIYVPAFACYLKISIIYLIKL